MSRQIDNNSKRNIYQLDWKKPNIYKLPSSCNLLPVCCCCYLLPRRRAGWITGAVVKKNGDSSWIQGAQVFFCLKKARNSGEVSPCVLGQVGHQQNEESKTQRLPREEIIRRMLFFSFSSTLSSVTFLLLAAFTLTHAKEQVSQSNQRASFFFLSFVLARWDGPGEREREERHENIKFSFLCLYLVHSLHMRTDRTCFAGLNGVVSG